MAGIDQVQVEFLKWLTAVIGKSWRILPGKR